MPAVNSKILQADYNDIRNKIVTVLGNGSGNSGYGQQARIISVPVTEGTTVTINEWANLRFDIINAYKHINGVNPTTAQVVENQTIRYTSNFTPDTGTLDVPQNQYDVWANNITTNRFGIAAGESGTTTAVSASRTGPWISQCTCTIQFNWANSDQARYWFNSGGKIRISASRSGGIESPTLGYQQNQAWTTLLSSAGTQSFGGAAPNASLVTSPNDGTNWYRTTNTFQTFYTATASSPYGSNNYQLQARCVDVANNSSGTAASGEIRVVFNDGYVDPATPPHSPTTVLPVDGVDGTLTVSVSLLFATGIMVPSSAVFTVTNPTVAIGAVTGS
jgi:hypothetical protein